MMKRFTAIMMLSLTALMFMPVQADGKKKEKKVGIVAHRGFWNCEVAGKAQNSIASLKCAQDAGVWGSEFDVYLTIDNKLVANHDAVVNGIEIEKATYEQARAITLPNGEQMPDIDEYLAQGKKCRNTVLVYEVKSNKLSDERQDLIADLSIQKVKEHKLSPKRVIFIAFSYRICKRIAEQMPGYTVQYLSSDKAPAEVHADGINGIDYHLSVFKKYPDWVKEAHDLGMSVNVWTVNNEEDMKLFYDMGVDQITTDNPLIARKVLEQNGIKENRK